MEKKIQVPEGMYNAARNIGRSDLAIKERLEASLRWLSKNPIVPTEQQLQAIADEHNRGKCYPENILPYVTGFQRRMFFAPEPEIPEAIKSLLWKNVPQADEFNDPVSQHNTIVLAAFLRGQNSR